MRLHNVKHGLALICGMGFGALVLASLRTRKRTRKRTKPREGVLNLVDTGLTSHETAVVTATLSAFKMLVNAMHGFAIAHALNIKDSPSSISVVRADMVEVTYAVTDGTHIIVDGHRFRITDDTPFDTVGDFEDAVNWLYMNGKERVVISLRELGYA